MKKRMLVKAYVLVAAIAAGVFAVETNYVRTTTYQVGADTYGTVNDAVSTDYSDGLGRAIQSKIALYANLDRTSCIFFDNAGRQKYVTKPFADNLHYGVYRAGDSADINALTGPLQTQYASMGADREYAFSSVDGRIPNLWPFF